MRYAIVAGLLSLFVGVTGCDHKPKGDPAACKTAAKDGDSCKSCCNKAGSSGHMWNGMSNECTCL